MWLRIVQAVGNIYLNFASCECEFSPYQTHQNTPETYRSLVVDPEHAVGYKGRKITVPRAPVVFVIYHTSKPQKLVVIWMNHTHYIDDRMKTSSSPLPRQSRNNTANACLLLVRFLLLCTFRAPRLQPQTERSCCQHLNSWIISRLFTHPTPRSLSLSGHVPIWAVLSPIFLFFFFSFRKPVENYTPTPYCTSPCWTRGYTT